MAYANGNYIVFKGCLNAARRGTVKLKFYDITTPQAVRPTSDFKIEMFREFDITTYGLTNPIIVGQKSIPASKFISGVMESGFI